MVRWAGMRTGFGLDATCQYAGGLKCVILRNIAAAGAMPVRRVAYRLLNFFPPNQFKFKIFWVDSDAHVRAMFELHRRYGSREVMELLTEMETANVDASKTKSRSWIACPNPASSKNGSSASGAGMRNEHLLGSNTLSLWINITVEKHK
ncbi:hypothetical protein PIB30_053965 [Stylosanthes scabra]|uniref:CRAL-TRIO domain-containing protein n=1 Tax=Stylosanthes scabra TaxID=79078 RepID=A0ABU6YH80_9FABA|nr:hypothetical protein [Stylosanthes scabra]